MTRLFATYDAWNRNCQDEEVGQPWEPRWGLTDIQSGLCTPSQLGKVIPAAELAEDGETPAYEPPMATPRLIQAANLRGIPLDDAEALALLALQLDPETFMQRNPTIYRDLISDQRQKRIKAASTLGKLKELTANQIGALYGSDIARFVAEAVLEVLPLPTHDDRQEALYRLLKLEPGDIEEMLEDA
jgi:hypothetical protein